tara:strand:- start:210 stop:461 length:252 start_codon:yes stop_codon:yes gene_type:complete
MIQLKGDSTTVTSATNLSKASAVRIRATSAGNVTIATVSPNVSNCAGVLALTAGEVVVIKKDPTDTIACSGSGMSCTPVAFHY